MLAVDSDCESDDGNCTDIPEPNANQEQFLESETTDDLLGKNDLPVENVLPSKYEKKDTRTSS